MTISWEIHGENGTEVSQGMSLNMSAKIANEETKKKHGEIL